MLATAATTGTEPSRFDLGALTRDTDVASGQGTSVSAAVVGNPVNTALIATAQGFDPAVASTTADLWQTAIGGALTVSPVLVQPGQSVTIPVTIAPSGAVGTRVSGTLYLDDDSLLSLYGQLAPNADTLAAIPYSYVIRR